MELWDLYDQHRTPLNQTAKRGKLIHGQYHIVASIFTINKHGEILITLRSPDKEKAPNLWETTAGSVIAGETSKQAAMRELSEETSICLKEDAFIFLDTLEYDHTFWDCYVVFHDVAIDTLQLQPGETVDAKWISFSQLKELIAQNKFTPKNDKTIKLTFAQLVSECKKHDIKLDIEVF